MMIQLETHGQAVRQIIENGDDDSDALFLFSAQNVIHENEATENHDPVYQPENYSSIDCIQTHPLPKGRSHISSKETDAKPNVDPRYFSHPLDLKLISRHLLMCLKIRDKEPISRYFKPDGKHSHDKAYIKNLEDAK